MIPVSWNADERAAPWLAGTRLPVGLLFTVKMISPKVKYLLLNLNPDVSATDVQNKLVAKDNEIQSLHSKLTDTMVSKQQLEQRMLQLMEAEQKRATAEDSMQMQVQVALLMCLKGLGFFPSRLVPGETAISLKCCSSEEHKMRKPCASPSPGSL